MAYVTYRKRTARTAYQTRPSVVLSTQNSRKFLIEYVTQGKPIAISSRQMPCREKFRSDFTFEHGRPVGFE